MGYKDALEDKIRTEQSQYGRCRYYIPCEVCGKEIIRTQYSRKRNYICDYCKSKIKKKKICKYEEIKTKCDVRYEKAVEEIKKQSKDFSDYEKSIRIAETRNEKYGSIPEAMVAIELIKNGYSIIPQQKIGKYKVDFLIPKEKIVVEVDGELYHKNDFKKNREAEIQIILGFDWKIIHIPAEKIRKDIKKLNLIICKFLNK